MENNAKHNNIINKFIFIALFMFTFFISLKSIFHMDVYHFLLYGNEIISSGGIPMYSTHNIHADLPIVLQEWAYDAIVFFAYDKLGRVSLFILQLGFFFILALICYRFLEKSSKQPIYLFSAFAIVMLFFGYSLTIRPIMLSYILLMIELVCIYKFAETDKIKWLLAIPITLFLEINFHATYWIFHYLFILAFLVPGIKLKKFSFESYKVNRKKLALVSLISLPVLLLNPYGLKSVTYLLNSISTPAGILKIDECQHVPVLSAQFVILLLTAISLLLLVRNKKLNSFEIYFVLGILAISFSMERNFSFIAFAWLILMRNKTIVSFFEDKIEHDPGYQKFKKYKKSIIIVSAVMLIASGILCFYQRERQEVAQNVDCAEQPFKAVEYMNEHSKSKTVFNDIGSGTFLECNGYIVFIDYCSETYSKQLNGKYDIIGEYQQYTKKKEYISVMDNYEYILAEKNSALDNISKKNKEIKYVLSGYKYNLYKNLHYRGKSSGGDRLENISNNTVFE